MGYFQGYLRDLLLIYLSLTYCMPTATQRNARHLTYSTSPCNPQLNKTQNEDEAGLQISARIKPDHRTNH